MKQLSKSTYGFIFAIVALVILLAISLYLGLSGWFYANVTSLESDISLGQTVNLDITKNGAQAVSFSFPGSLLPGQKLPQNINITNSSGKDMFVRAKAVVFNYSQGEVKMEVGVSEHWTQDGEYYYFDEIVPSSNKIALGSHIKLLPDQEYSSTKTYILTIVVEALDSSLNKEQIWAIK